MHKSKAGNKRKHGLLDQTDKTDHSITTLATQPTSLLDDTIQNVVSSFSPKRAVATAKFQMLLGERKTQLAMKHLEDVGKKNIDFTKNYLPSTFISCVVSIISLPCKLDQERRFLLDILKSEGLLTQKELSATYTIRGQIWTPLHHAVGSITSPLVYTYLRDNVDLSSMILNANTDCFDTPLTLALGINVTCEGKNEFTEDIRNTLDQRAAEIINLLPDEALNIPNKIGFTPLAVAVMSCRTLALVALIHRMPVVDFYPEHRISKGEPLRSIDHALDMMKNRGQFMDLWPLVRYHVDTARVLTQEYSDGLEKVTSLILEHCSSIPNDISNVIFQYSKPIPSGPSVKAPPTTTLTPGKNS